MAEIEDKMGDLPPSSGVLVDSAVAVKSEVQPAQNPDQTEKVLGSKRPYPDDDGHEKAENDANCKRHKLENGAEPDVLAPAPSLTSDPASYPTSVITTTTTAAPVPTLSKNQLRKLRRRDLWVEKKKDKRLIRNQKRKEKQEQKRIEKEAEIAAAARQPKPTQVQAPVTVILDCQFEKYMMEKELVSLSNQVTRCYSDNRNSRYPVHMFVSSYGGHMKERNETILQNQFKNWKNVHFVEGDFLDAATRAKELMGTPKEGQAIEALAQGKEGDAISLVVPDHDGKKKQKSAPVPEPEVSDVDKSIVYLTADSPYTIDRLEPGVSYVIGGIIDKNREKGLCYKIAREKKVRTAKLPIGEFMVMQSRHVLATNHVMEIMLQWLETGDWGKAFMKVIPTRKGGKLKEDGGKSEVGQANPEVTTPEDQSTNNAVTTEDVDVTSPQSNEPRNPTTQEPDGPAQTEGEGLDGFNKEAEKISSDQQPWSVPPVQQARKETLAGNTPTNQDRSLTSYFTEDRTRLREPIMYTAWNA
ncbi:guanine-1-methyltransferase-domain-containing protein [Annulohypoxylon truncatum]|uniref:guanine-1-methyltransferase-domain-containing protein n=1 Tax=Annulohypoxylon truncatum TaxID=327061 RepID=UPI0020074270|nr:guanine-1-methyltransferase-domain-containing protein [Annulohypoxylon truncatum]KAI1204222.1 guanine-1-methyltransferase-domain-containing protein [Annulohypoxylon truncatum]